MKSLLIWVNRRLELREILQAPYQELTKVGKLITLFEGHVGFSKCTGFIDKYTLYALMPLTGRAGI